MKSKTIVLILKWYQNDRGGDQRPLTIDYINDKDLAAKTKKVLSDFRNLPMDIGDKFGKVPYSVTIK